MTPKPYLSYSSLTLLEKNVEKWKEAYLYGGKMPINRGMAFGKKLADGLENDETTGDDVLDSVMTLIPKFEIRDKEFLAEIKTGKDVVPILCKPDTMKADMTAFKEYKTAQKRWTKSQVDASDQITFYAMGMFLKTGKIPWDIELVEIETKQGADLKISATGAIYRHKTSRSTGQILNMMIRAKKAWSIINKICEEELI